MLKGESERNYRQDPAESQYYCAGSGNFAVCGADPASCGPRLLRGEHERPGDAGQYAGDRDGDRRCGSWMGILPETAISDLSHPPGSDPAGCRGRLAAVERAGLHADAEYILLIVLIAVAAPVAAIITQLARFMTEM